MSRKKKNRSNENDQTVENINNQQSLKVIDIKPLPIDERKLKRILDKNKMSPLLKVIPWVDFKKVKELLEEYPAAQEEVKKNQPINQGHDYVDTDGTLYYQDIDELNEDDRSELLDLVNDWYEKLKASLLNPETKHFPILGFVSSGGFLQGENDEPFVLPYQSNINLFIGHRGSGKSTILHLLSLLENVLAAETEHDNIAEWIRPKRENFNFDTGGSRKAYKILAEKSIEEYMCFFL